MLALDAFAVTVMTPVLFGVPETVHVTAALTASDNGVAGEQTGAFSPISVAPDTTHVAPSAAIVPLLVQLKVNVVTAMPDLTVWLTAALAVSTVVVVGGGTLVTVSVRLRFAGVAALPAVVASSYIVTPLEAGVPLTVQLMLCPAARSATVAPGRHVKLSGVVTVGVAAQVTFFADIVPLLVHLNVAACIGCPTTAAMLELGTSIVSAACVAVTTAAGSR